LIDVQNYDYFVLAADLPYYLNLDFDHIPEQNGYLIPDKEKVKYFKEKYFQNNKFKIGLCWKAGGIGIRGAINRTINIDYFKKMFDWALDKNVEFYSIQLGDIFDAYEKYPQIVNLEEEIHDFDDTSAIIENCDLCITVDTSSAHVAGAIGKKTFLLIPYCADWRWFNHDKSTEWYSSVELFKQKDRQDWFIEVDEIIERLKVLL
jgi:ADP-heptose:LPS heptosyltransferase